MAEIIMITGGINSGKSDFAEEMTLKKSRYNSINPIYVATSIPYDEEMKRKIRLHIEKRRGKGWHNIQAPLSLIEIVKSNHYKTNSKDRSQKENLIDESIRELDLVYESIRKDYLIDELKQEENSRENSLAYELKQEKNSRENSLAYELKQEENSRDNSIRKINSVKKVVLVDCITMLVSNNIFIDRSQFEKGSILFIGEEDTYSRIDEIKSKILSDIEEILLEIRKTDDVYVFVTNEIGLGGISGNKMTRMFAQICGDVNKILASNSDEVYMVVSSIPMKIK